MYNTVAAKALNKFHAVSGFRDEGFSHLQFGIKEGVNHGKAPDKFHSRPY